MVAPRGASWACSAWDEEEAVQAFAALRLPCMAARGQADAEQASPIGIGEA